MNFELIRPDGMTSNGCHRLVTIFTYPGNENIDVYMGVEDGKLFVSDFGDAAEVCRNMGLKPDFKKTQNVEVIGQELKVFVENTKVLPKAILQLVQNCIIVANSGKEMEN